MFSPGIVFDLHQVRRGPWSWRWRYIDLTISSVIFFASPNSIIVLSR